MQTETRNPEIQNTQLLIDSPAQKWYAENDYSPFCNFVAQKILIVPIVHMLVPSPFRFAFLLPVWR